MCASDHEAEHRVREADLPVVDDGRVCCVRIFPDFHEVAAGAVVPFDRPVLIPDDPVRQTGPAAGRVLHPGVAAVAQGQVAAEGSAARVLVDPVDRRDKPPRIQSLCSCHCSHVLLSFLWPAVACGGRSALQSRIGPGAVPKIGTAHIR